MRDRPVWAFGDFELDQRAWRLTRAGQQVPVEPKGLEVLALLIERAGEVVTKNEILDTVWRDAAVTENAMVRVIAVLRTALDDDAKDARYVETVHRRGYRFIAPVTQRNVPQPDEPAPVTAAPPAQGVRTRRALVGGAALVLLAATVAALILLYRHQGPAAARSLDRAKVLVAPFENLTGDATLDPLARMCADAISQGLLEVGWVEVVAAGRSQAGSDERTWSQAARAAGAGTVVTGSYSLSGGDTSMRGRVLDAATGKPVFVLDPELAPRDQPAGAVERVRQRIMSALVLRLDRAPGLGRQAVPPLYDALVEFLAGTHLSAVDPRAAVPHFERSVTLDSGFWHARVRLVHAYSSAGMTEASEALREQIEESVRKLCPSDRVYLGFVDAMIARRYREAYRKAQEGLAMAPSDPGMITAVAYLALRLNRPREAVAAAAGLRSTAREHLSTWTQGATLLGTVAFAHHLLGEHEAELAVTETAVRTYPDRLDVRQDQVRALAALGRVAEIDRVVAECLTVRTAVDTPGGVMLAAAQELRAHGHPEDAKRLAAQGADWFATLTGGEAATAAVTLSRFQCLWLSGRITEARAVIDASYERRESRRSHTFDLLVTGYRGIVAARTGDTVVASAMDATLAGEDDVKSDGRCSWLRACIAAQRGDRDGAVALLNAALAHGFGTRVNVGFLHVFAFLEPLHGYAPFEELLAPKG